MKETDLSGGYWLMDCAGTGGRSAGLAMLIRFGIRVVGAGRRRTSPSTDSVPTSCTCTADLPHLSSQLIVDQLSVVLLSK